MMPLVASSSGLVSAQFGLLFCVAFFGLVVGCRCNSQGRLDAPVASSRVGMPKLSTASEASAPFHARGGASYANTVSAAPGASCTVSAGDIYCWGTSLGGEDAGAPVRLTPGGLEFEDVSRSSTHVCGRTRNREVWCAGSNSYDELGGVSKEKCATGPYPDGSVVYYPCSKSLLRVQAVPAVKDIVTAPNRTCATTIEGSVFCWGVAQDSRQQALRPSSPTKVGGLGAVRQLALGTFFGCALIADGTVSCWGSNQEGQLGRGTSDDIIDKEPKRVSGISGARTIAAGSNHACTLTGDAGRPSLLCWGSNLRGQISGPQEPKRESLTQPTEFNLPVGVADVRQVALGGQTTCVLSGEGALYCAGEGVPKVLGTGLQRIPGVPPLLGVASGGAHLCGITRGGNVLSWGEPTLANEETYQVKCDACATPLVEVPDLHADVH
jgi:alpha-tubulin suppressor-like RCC1 family protein